MKRIVTISSIECTDAQQSTDSKLAHVFLSFDGNILGMYDLSCSAFQTANFTNLKPQELRGAATSDIKLWRIDPNDPQIFESCSIATIYNNEQPGEKKTCFKCFDNLERCITYYIDIKSTENPDNS